MQKERTAHILLASFIIVTIYSCVPQKKVVSVKKELSAVDSQLQQYNYSLKKLNEQRTNKKEQNEIDDTANARIEKFITRTAETISQLNAENTVLISNTPVERADWEKLVKSLSKSKRSSKEIGDRIDFLKDLIKQNLVIKIDQDIIFSPGKYTVTPAMASSVSNFFEPPAKEIELFMKKYPDFPLSLVITANGYADATSITEGSSLYKDLKARLQLTGREPDNKELNKELSRARAEDVILLFKKFAAERPGGSGKYLENVLYLHEGKGEALPDPKTPDYKIDDRRRRVVLLFWSVFPE